ncbi:MAG: hypothetical protein L0211_09390 [Planctomycetaceae bacterium]|nr:hypothetical protein [Planctomycetaceae bacterium]
MGWFELAQQYPDQGSLVDVAWHPAMCWLNLKAFRALASANQHGLRVALSLHADAFFVPWPDAAISARRGWQYTVIRIRLPASPGMTLAIVADDQAADDLLRPAGIALHARKCQRCPRVWVGIGLAILLGAIITVAVFCQ